MRKTVLKWLGLFACLGIGAVVAYVAQRQPSLDRNWDEDVRVLASVASNSPRAVILEGVRNWRYSRSEVINQAYLEQVYHPDQIVDIWMYEQALGMAGLIAHTFVVFEFADISGPQRFLGLSVETRREVGEEYSLMGGVMREFEITHIWATETDLVTRRVEYLDYPLTRYRLKIPSEYRTEIFRKFVDETHALASVPGWYNTLSDNCTSSLVEYVNDAEPGAIPLHYSYVLTGRMNEYLDSLGYLDSQSALSITREYLASHDLR